MPRITESVYTQTGEERKRIIRARLLASHGARSARREILASVSRLHAPCPFFALSYLMRRNFPRAAHSIEPSAIRDRGAQSLAPRIRRAIRRPERNPFGAPPELATPRNTTDGDGRRRLAEFRTSAPRLVFRVPNHKAIKFTYLADVAEREPISEREPFPRLCLGRWRNIEARNGQAVRLAPALAAWDFVRHRKGDTPNAARARAPAT